jgi:predicted nucleic acid-binding protein
MIVVSDISPVTTLIRVDRIALLEQLYGVVLVPEAVLRELSHSHPQIPSFLETRAVRDRAEIARLSSELDLGEAEAIVLAKEAGADLLLIDEKMGRWAALREGLAIIGLMGVLISAKRRGLIPAAGALVNVPLRRGVFLTSHSQCSRHEFQLSAAGGRDGAGGRVARRRSLFRGVEPRRGRGAF